MSESSYPYMAVDQNCSYNANNAYDFNVASWTAVPADSVADLQSAVAQQPVSVTIQADKLCFQMYSSGVLNNEKCGTSLDHAVAAVGYGNEDGQDYWLVRNSWGSSWGLNGYIKIAAVEGPGICGIQMDSLWPSV